MYQRGDQFHFHPLTERELTHHNVHFVGDLEQLGQAAHNFVETIAIDSINRAVEFERFLRGQIPPERVLLAHQQRELSFHFVAPFPWNKSEHACIAAGWIEQPREHFEDGRLAGTVRSEKSDELAFLDLK